MGALPPLLAISSRRLLGACSLVTWARELERHGVHWAQLREPDLGDNEVLSVLRAIRDLGLDGPRIVVNGRADLAHLGGAAGVHLPARGVPIAEVRGLLGDDALVGRSTHAVSEVEAAWAEGADYVLFGPIYPPLSKTASRAPVGLEGLRRATAVPVPLYALGGVTIGRLAELAAAGVSGAAGISMFTETTTLRSLVAEAERVFP